MPIAPTKRRTLAHDLRLVPLGFLALILLGTALLSLPAARTDNIFVGFIDTLFLATSATCVTGLSTVNVGNTYNFFGQGILLALIQIGGLGIMTAGTLFAILGGRRLSLLDESYISATVGKLRGTGPLDIFIYGCSFVIIFELAGSLLLGYLLMTQNPEQPIGQVLWEAVFHSVSAFCNAGISLYPEGLMAWQQHHLNLFVVSLLAIAGGIGLMTLVNLRYYYPWRKDSRKRGRLTLQTKLALITSGVLIVIGTLFVFALESNRSFVAGSWSNKLSWAFFHSVMTRTAGYNATEIGDMHPGTHFTSMVLMFIGGAPGSMAGGIKTLTFALLVLTTWSALRRRSDLTIMGRTIPNSQALTAVMFVLLSVACVGVAVVGLTLTESTRNASESADQWLALTYEAVSAFGTVGLSTGITGSLTTGGKIIIILLMFVGRVGPLMLAIYLARPAENWRVRYPKETISLG